MFKSIAVLALFAIVAGVHSVDLGNTVYVDVPQAVSYQSVVPVLPSYRYAYPVYRHKAAPGIGASLGAALITPLGTLGGGVRAGISPYGAGISAGVGITAPGVLRGRYYG